MKADVVLAGVGGQGTLTVAAVLAEAARRGGLTVKQGEVHGMSQRGGAVRATLRLAEGPIASDLIPKGAADLILGLEPVEALRQLEYLAPGGILLTATDPLRNVPDYPPIEEVLAQAREIPGALLVDAGDLARRAGSGRAANVVMLGAAARFLPVPVDTLEAVVAEVFADRGERIAAANVRALREGLAALASSAR